MAIVEVARQSDARPISLGDISSRLELGAPEEALSLAAIVAVQAANNETGVTQSLSDVASLTKAKGGFVVCDAVQAVGRVPLRDLSEADALFFSAHKFGGPKGAGAVVWRSGGVRPARRAKSSALMCLLR